MDRWKKSRYLGGGRHGKVESANKDDKVIVVKSAKVDEEGWLKHEQVFLKELIDEPYIVRCFGTDESLERGVKTYSLILEHTAKGDLDHVLIRLCHEKARMDEIRVAQFTRMILTALSNIHARGIIHRNLKPSNILVFPATGGHPELVKIADFRLAERSETTLCPKSESPTKKVYKVRLNNGTYLFSSPKKPDQVHLNKGTLLYSSPETVTGGEYGPHTDIWSLGIIVAEMMDPGTYFFDPDQDLYDQIVHKPLELRKRLPFSSITAIDFLAKCLDRNPANRWSARQLLKHPFITENLEDTDLLAAGDHHEVKAENPIQPSTDWMESHGLFTTDEDNHFTAWMKNLFCFSSKS